MSCTARRLEALKSGTGIYAPKPKNEEHQRLVTRAQRQAVTLERLELVRKNAAGDGADQGRG